MWKPHSSSDDQRNNTNLLKFLHLNATLILQRTFKLLNATFDWHMRILNKKKTISPCGRIISVYACLTHALVYLCTFKILKCFRMAAPKLINGREANYRCFRLTQSICSFSFHFPILFSEENERNGRKRRNENGTDPFILDFIILLFLPYLSYPIYYSISIASSISTYSIPNFCPSQKSVQNLQ